MSVSFLEIRAFKGFCLHFSPRSYKTFFPKRMLIPSSNASFGSPSFFQLLSEKSRERAVEMQSSSKVGELKTNFLFWDKEPLHLVEKEKGLVPYFFYFGSGVELASLSVFSVGLGRRDLVFNQKITVVLTKIISKRFIWFPNRYNTFFYVLHTTQYITIINTYLIMTMLPFLQVLSIEDENGTGIR